MLAAARWLAVVSVAGCAAGHPRASAPPTPMNVLFIAVDDLRPFLGAYGAAARTPNIDALAARGALFDRAYCQQALCNPSRSSLLTGRRPATTGVHDLETEFRARLPDAVTLPQAFKLRGYTVIGLAKIFHDDKNDRRSWSEPLWWPRGVGLYSAATAASLTAQLAERTAHGNPSDDRLIPSWEAPDVPDDALWDGQIATRAVETLRRLKGRPFFLAVGFSKPHLPFVAPRRYYDWYPPERVALANNPFPPAGAPAFALTDSEELRHYVDIPEKGPVPPEKARELVRGYYASVSYLDAQVGRVLDELDALDLRRNTIVVLWGDHGWHLGEHGIWCKATTFEVAARAPLIVSAPGMPSRGVKIEALVELVDVFPSLLELAGLPTMPGLEGTSFVPLLRAPRRSWKRAAFTDQPRGGLWATSMRTTRFRYTEWTRGNEVVARELYDHDHDPDENVNLAGDPAWGHVLRELAALLRDGWKKAAP